MSKKKVKFAVNINHGLGPMPQSKRRKTKISAKDFVIKKKGGKR